MASNDQDAKSPLSALQSRFANAARPSPAMWPPVYGPPNGARFREFVWRIDFENNPDADEMFKYHMPGLRPMSPPPAPAPTYSEEYPARPRSALLMPPLRPEDFQSRQNTPPLPPSRHEDDSEDGLEEDLEEYPEDDLEDGLEDDLEEDLANNPEDNPTRPDSPPLPCLLLEDFPPLRRPRLGKTDVPIQRQHQVSESSSDDVESCATEDTVQPNESRSVMGPLPTPKPHEANCVNTGNAMRADSRTSHVGPPPAQKRRRVESVPAPANQVKVTSDMGRPAIPKPRNMAIARTTPTTSYNGYNESLLNLNTQFEPRLYVMDPQPRPQPRNVEFGHAGNSAVDASTSHTDPPPKRQRLTNHFTASKRRSEREGDGEPGVDIRHTHDDEKAARQSIEALLRPGQKDMRRPRSVERPEEKLFHYGSNLTSEQMLQNSTFFPIGSDLQSNWEKGALWARSQ